MKVLLIQPPIEDFFYTETRSYPLGLLYLATKIKDIADVEIVDLRKRKVKFVQNPFLDLEEFFRKDVTSPFSLFRGYKRYGLNEKEIEDILAKKEPDLICVSSLFSAYFDEALKVAQIAKDLDPRIKVVFGGHHPTYLPDKVLSKGCVDYVIRGEGETPLFKLVDALMSNRAEKLERIEGLCFKKGNYYRISEVVSYEEDIDMLPERSLIDKDSYRIGKKNYSFVVTSRGCPNSCSFCAKMRVPFRERRINSIKDELESILHMGINWIDFEDDMLSGERLYKILDLLKDKEVYLSAMNGIHPDSLNRDLLVRMKECGFVKLNISIVDLCRNLILSHGRRQAVSLDEILQSCESLDLDAEVHFILGLPGQKKKDVLETISYLSQKRCLLGPSVFYLHPLNPMCEKVLGENWREKTKYMRSSLLLPADNEFSRLSLFTFLKICRFINFLKGKIDSAKSNLGLGEIEVPHPVERECFLSLIKERKFKAYDEREKKFFYEPCDTDLIESFFDLMRGKKVFGFRTSFYLEFRL